MAAPRPSKTHIGNHALKPETLMLGYGYDPSAVGGRGEAAGLPHLAPSCSARPRKVATSSTMRRDASSRPQGSGAGLVYSPLQPSQQRDRRGQARRLRGRGGPACCSHPACRRSPRRSWPSPAPATSSCIPSRSTAERKRSLSRTMAGFGIGAVGFVDGVSEPAIRAAAQEARGKGAVSVILIETPANPTNTLVDIKLLRQIADEIGTAQGFRPVLVCDNTLLGPVFQRPLAHGADVSVYSLTKYVGGHSDLIAGATLASKATIGPIRALRGSVGTSLDPHSCWMLGRSLETLALRMERSQHQCPARRRVSPRSCQGRQGSPPGVPGGWLEGAGGLCPAMQRAQARPSPSTSRAGRRRRSPSSMPCRSSSWRSASAAPRSLASHPAAMTHSGVPAEVRDRIGVLDTTIRLSVGIEHPDDLIADLAQALAVTA